MKFFILSASLLSVFVGLSSCESHDWDKTKKLYESHGDASHAAPAADSHADHDHGDGHGHAH